jgi:6-pyruvoyltetrahydropterin/6-carboxytetrahydropterin synthase
MSSRICKVRKTYGHERGYSSVFRQHRAKSHCRFIHGYALAFEFIFACRETDLDENGWVIDFGSLKPLKAYLDDHFDHKMLVATDDPALELFIDLAEEKRKGKLLDVVMLPAVGCENFARHLYELVDSWLFDRKIGRDCVWLESVEVREHGSNGAIICRDDIRTERVVPNHRSQI